jgi:hypothetical protein
MPKVSKAMEYAATFEREARREKLDAALGDLDHMSLIQLEAMALKHEQQIKDLGAHLLELKQLVTPMMQFKRSGWVGLTEDEKAYSNTNYLGKSAEAWHGGVEWAEDRLKERNGG